MINVLLVICMPSPLFSYCLTGEIELKFLPSVINKALGKEIPKSELNQTIAVMQGDDSATKGTFCISELVLILVRSR